MAEDSFISLDNQFVLSHKSPGHTSYESPYHYQTLSEPHFSGRVFFHSLVVRASLEEKSSLFEASLATDSPEKAQSLAQKYANFQHATYLLQKFRDFNQEQKLSDMDTVDKLCALVDKVNAKKIAFYEQYGDFYLSPFRKSFDPLFHKQLSYLSNHTQQYLEEAEELNKSIRQCKVLFEKNVKPFMFEKLKADSFGGLERFIYMPAEKFSYLFPFVSVGVAQKKLVAALDKLKNTNQSILDCLDSVEKRNAKKDLKGYVLYHNLGTSEGFVNIEGYLTPNLLGAKIFETSDQAFLYSKRRRKPECAVIEIDFSFSKIAIQNKCASGEVLQNLIVRRQAADLQEILPVLDFSTEARPVRKNKI